MQQPQLQPNGSISQVQPIAPIPPASDGTFPSDWLGGIHPNGRLEVTRGFYPYADKLSRALSYLAQERQPRRSVYEQLAEVTGMSAARIEALAQYGINMELLAPRSLQVTPLGHLALQHDPFFDQPGTLWLGHYLFASNPALVVWNYMCNSVLPGVAQISKIETAEQFLPFAGRWTEDSIRKKVPKEVRAFFAAYTEEMFASLNYLREVSDNLYAVNRDVILVPPPILLATILIYRDRHQPGSSGIEIPTLVYADHSPGRLMRQSELNMRRSLDQLHEAGYLTIESKANLDQVRFRSGLTWLDAVRLYYRVGSSE